MDAYLLLIMVEFIPWCEIRGKPAGAGTVQRFSLPGEVWKGHRVEGGKLNLPSLA